MEEKYYCPCCGYNTLTEEPPGTYQLCPICLWEDDREQFNNPDKKTGSNPVSLHQAKLNFQRFGACHVDVSEFVIQPDESYKRDPNWRVK